MMKTNIRKYLVLACCAVLLVCVSVGATLAYLTSTDAVTNTFTVGNVAIKLDEAKVDANGDAVTPEERVKTNSYKLLPGHEYDKDPTVTVQAKSEECYVRLIVTVNKKSALDAIGVNTLEVFQGYDATKWTAYAEKADGDNMVYEFRYFDTVKYSETDTKLPALFTGMKMPGAVTKEQLATINGLQIKIEAHAIQADGFQTADTAWAVFTK